MPSSFYRITITNPGGLSAPNDGFIDPTPLEDYVTSFESPPSGLTLALSTAKRRANQRFLELTVQLGLAQNIYIDTSVTSISTPSGAYDTEPSSLTFTAEVEHGDSTLVTPDELNAGQYLTGTAALSRMVQRALIHNQTSEMSVIDPTMTVTTGNATTYIRYGRRIANIAVGPIAGSLTAAGSLVTITTILSVA